jgi:tetratricopeptide (TPR) repeat protein
MSHATMPKKNQPESVSIPKSRRRDTIVICLLLAAAVFMVFGQTLHHEFVNLDDEDYVYQNPEVVRGLTVQGITWAFTHGYASNWHPLTWISHMLDCQLYGLNPGGHHLTSVLLHAATTALLFLVLRRMTGALWPSAVVAAVFAIHPLRAESVAWVSERKDVLSGLFFMLTLAAYVRYARNPFSLGRYLLVALCLALGLMSKPMLVTLPFVLLLLDYWPLGRMPRTASGAVLRALRPLIVEKIPLLALSAASCVVTVLVQGEAVATIQRVPVPIRIGNSAVSYIAYLGQMVFPMGLAAFYPLAVNNLVIWKAGVALVLLAGISAGVVWLRRSRPYLLVGWLWYVGMLVPVIGLLQVGDQARADRYTYLPQIGVYLLVVWAVWEMVSSRRYGRLLFGVASVSAIAGLMACATIQTSYWRNSESLWIHALSCTSRNYAAHNNLGGALFEQGRSVEAIEHYQKCLEIRPDFAEARFNLAHALAAQGRSAEAIQQYQRAFENAPDNAEEHDNLGTVLLGQGRSVEAIQQYQKALEIKPDFAQAYYNLANALAAQGRIAEAIQQYQLALRIKPDYVEARSNLANALAAQGRSAEAIEQYQKTLETAPGNAGAHNNLGTVLLRQGRSAEAIEQYQQALEINPDFAEARYNLANVLAAQGRTVEAIEQYQQALRIRPDYAQARHKLERLQHGQ